jgi:hypothetical protein
VSRRLTPVSWDDLVRNLMSMGLNGPYRSGKHYFMVKGEFKLTIPNPHRQEIGVPLLKEILNRAGINRHEWLHRK